MDTGDFIFSLGIFSFLIMLVFLTGGIILSIVKRTTRYVALILCVFLTTQLFSCQAMVYGIDYDDVASPNYEMYQTMTFLDYASDTLPYLIFIGVLTALCYFGINKKSKTARSILLGAMILAAVFIGLCCSVSLV